MTPSDLENKNVQIKMTDGTVLAGTIRKDSGEPLGIDVSTRENDHYLWSLAESAPRLLRDDILQELIDNGRVTLK